MLQQARIKALLSDEHFSVDGTLIEARASMKSFTPKDVGASSDNDDTPPPPNRKGRNAERDFHGEKRSNATHASTTDPDARLFKKARGHRHQQDFVAALEATGIRPVLDQAFPLADLHAAYEYQTAGRHFGKIPVTIKTRESRAQQSREGRGGMSAG